jgi:hypothetical protein
MTGETTALSIGSSNVCAVVAELRWPAGVERKPRWFVLAQVETPSPAVPPGIGTNQAAREAYYQSPEYLAFLQNGRSLPAKEQEDGKLRAEDVEPGNYQFFVAIAEMPDTPPPVHGHVVLEGRVPVTVPSDPPNGTFDAGVIDLQPSGAKH